MNMNAIIVYEKNKINSYSLRLDEILKNIRNLNEIIKKIHSYEWDFNIKYKSSIDKNLMKLESKYYQERDKWVDFIYFVEDNNSLSVEDLLKEKLKLVLLLFWKDIPNNLNLETVFKLQLKLSLIFIGSKGSFDNNLIYYDSVNIGQVRSVGSINIYSKNNFHFLFIRLF